MSDVEALTEADLHTIVVLVGELAPQPVPPPDLDARLIEDLDYHSLALAELAIAIADAFALDVDLDDDGDDDGLEQLLDAGTVRDLVRLVADQLARNRP
jgi:acyl carrier protein